MKTFLTPTKFPHGAADFSLLNEDKLLALIKEEAPKAIKEYNEIANNPAPPTFENTVVAFENSKKNFMTLMNAFSLLGDLKNTPKLKKMTPQINKIVNKVDSVGADNPRLFKRIKKVYENRAHLNLDKEDLSLLTDSYRGQILAGNHLSKSKRLRLKKIDEDLSNLQMKFAENYNNDEEQTIMFFNESQAELFKTVPDHLMIAAKQLAKKLKKKGFAFSLSYSTTNVLMTEVPDREVRKEICKRSAYLGAAKNKNNNEEVVKKSLKLMDEQSKILGFKNFVDLTFQDRMESNPQAIKKFLMEVNTRSKKKSEKVLKTLSNFAKKTFGYEEMLSSDIEFVAKRYQEKDWGPNKDSIVFEEYFPLSHVKNEMFRLYENVFGIRFKPVSVPVYHKDVETYLVSNEVGEELGILYCDLYERPHKVNSPLALTFKAPTASERTHVILSTSFSNKTKDFLMDRDSLKYLYHEMGHAVHALCSKNRYESTSSEAVMWDFVELPSQLMENWINDEKYIYELSKHYKTGKKIDLKKNPSLVKREILDPYYIHRRSVLSLWDLELFSRPPQEFKDIPLAEKKFYSRFKIIKSPVDGCITTSMDHLFSYSYASGFYCYLYAEMLDSDVFSVFKKNGITNPKTGRAYYKEILEVGATRNEMDSIKAFTKRSPSTAAFFKKYGM